MAQEAGQLGGARTERLLRLRRWWIGRAGRGSIARPVASVATRRHGHILRGFAAALATLLLSCAMLAGAAQPAKKNPAWSELTPEQQQILAPLSAEWDKLEPARKRKWLGIAKRYPKMTPIGQKRAQTRMQKWIKLSPEQRREAREKYRSITKLPPEKRQDLNKSWAEYQALPPAERQKVAPPPSNGPSAKRKRPRASPPSEAAAESYQEW